MTTMSKTENFANEVLRYPSTNVFHRVINNSNWKGEKEMRKIEYFGTVKIHGTNGNIIWRSENEIYFQAKERIIEPGKQDNMNFAKFLSGKNFSKIFSQIKGICIENKIPLEYPIQVAGEWAGKKIQKYVAVSKIEPFFTIFRIGIGMTSTGKMIWMPPHLFGNVHDNDERIFNCNQFFTFEKTIDRENLSETIEELEKLVLEIENECPVGKYFGVDGIGEGIVLTPKKKKISNESKFLDQNQREKTFRYK